MRYLHVALFLGALALGGCANSWHHWADTQGGLLTDARQTRADLIAQRLVGSGFDRPIHLHILNDPAVAAYSFASDDVFLTRGLMDLGDDDQIAAAIAHELGHLLNDGHLHGPAALHDPGQNLDVEARADAMGCEVLIRSGIAPQAMTEVLRLAVKAGCSRECAREIQQRIALLEARANAATMTNRARG